MIIQSLQKRKESSDVEAEKEEDFELPKENPFKGIPFENIEEKPAEGPFLPGFKFPEDRLTKKLSFETGGFKILSVRFDPMDNFLALGCDDGHVRIFQSQKEKCLINLFEDSPNIAPSTCVRWKPFTQMTKNILITGHTDGSLNHWHATSKKIIHSLVEKDTHIYALDYNVDGSCFATGGRDGQVRLYDENKISEVKVLEEGSSAPTHKNRIYALKFIEPNVLITGGWDKVVLVWDTRTSRSQSFLYGPTICGDSLDFSEQSILTGSWRSEEQLELWDIRTMKRTQALKWVDFDENIEKSQQSLVYTCQFQKGKGDFIVAGSCGNNEIRLFERKKGWECVDGLRGLEQGVFSVDWGNENERDGFCYGGGEGLCGLIKL